jgi:hypothetical protein
VANGTSKTTIQRFVPFHRKESQAVRDNPITMKTIGAINRNFVDISFCIY